MKSKEEAFFGFMNTAKVDAAAREALIHFTAIWMALVDKGLLTNEETMEYYNRATAVVDKNIAEEKKVAEKKLEEEMPEDIWTTFGLDKIL